MGPVGKIDREFPKNDRTDAMNYREFAIRDRAVARDLRRFLDATVPLARRLNRESLKLLIGDNWRSKPLRRPRATL